MNNPDYEANLKRARWMATYTGDGEWVLSSADQRALQAVLARLEELESP